jgi:hypothetical protein
LQHDADGSARAAVLSRSSAPPPKFHRFFGRRSRLLAGSAFAAALPAAARSRRAPTRSLVASGRVPFTSPSMISAAVPLPVPVRSCSCPPPPRHHPPI